MPQRGVLLAIGDQDWRLVAPGRPAEPVPVASLEPVEAAGKVRQRLMELDPRAQRVCLGLPADWVLACPIATADLPRRRRSFAMLYRLEEALPMEAEQLTAQFVEFSPDRAMGLAVQTQQVAPLLEALEQAGLEVPAICPTDWLAAWAYVTNDVSAAPDYLILVHDQQAQVLRLVSGRPAGWYSCPADAHQILQSLRVDRVLAPLSSSQPRLAWIGQDVAGLEGQLAGQGYQLQRDTGMQVLEWAARAAAQRIASQAGWVNFRTGRLAQTHLDRQTRRLARLTAVAAAVLAVALTGSLWGRGLRYQAAAGQSIRQQEALFSGVFPGQGIPVNVPSRLGSELTRLEGLSGGGGDLPPTPSALDTLARIVAAMPGSVRLRLTNLQVSPTLVHLEGQSRTHADAEALAAALRSGGMSCESPRTEVLLGGGVNFLIAGAPSDKEAVP